LIYWNVNALSDEAEQHLIQPLLNNDDPSFPGSMLSKPS
jgi:hypothetical protein